MKLLKKPTPEPFIFTRYSQENVSASKKDPIHPNFPKIGRALQKDERYAWDTFITHVVTPERCRRLMDEAKLQANKTTTIKKLLGNRGYSYDAVCASSSLMPITLQSAMEMPMDVLWDYIFQGRGNYYCYQLNFNCKADGSDGKWSAYVYRLKLVDKRLETFANPGSSLPLPQQMDYLGAMLQCMHVARMVIGFRICWEIAKFRDTEKQLNQFIKLVQFLFPTVEFTKNPLSWKLSPYLNSEHMKSWGILKDPYINCIERYDITTEEGYNTARGTMLTYCRRMVQYSAPDDDKEFDAAKTLDAYGWKEVCVPIMEADRKRAIAEKEKKEKQ